MKYTEQDITTIISNIHTWYDREHAELVNFAEKHKQDGGQKREASGRFIENFLQNIFDEINKMFNIQIISKVGSTDFLTKKINYNGKIYELNHIQVDRHVSYNNKRIAFIENKTYLDSCYWDRALADFRKIIASLKQNGYNPEDMEYIVFSGQDSLDHDTKLAYEGDFFNDSKMFTSNKKGIKPHVFFFLDKKRSSQKPMYKIKFDIQDKVLKEFIELILNLV